METGLADNLKFLQLSDAFKKIFSSDKKDRNIVIPISGYQGHRRGATAQNFFGKSYRDVSIQSKRYQRGLYKNPIECDV